MTDFRHPLAKARGLGSAKSGAKHWIAQRITAVALLPLSLWFALAATGLVGGEYADARVFFAQPWNACWIMLFIACLLYHAQLGMQVVIEDYVHAPWLEISLQVLTKLLVLVGLACGLLSIFRMLQGG